MFASVADTFKIKSTVKLLTANRNRSTVQARPPTQTNWSLSVGGIHFGPLSRVIACECCYWFDGDCVIWFKELATPTLHGTDLASKEACSTGSGHT